MTSEDFQRYVRILFYVIAGNLMQRGYISEGSMELWGGVVMMAANFVWSIWGMRLQAKLAEISKYGEVKKVVADPHIADVQMASNPKVVSS